MYRIIVFAREVAVSLIFLKKCRVQTPMQCSTVFVGNLSKSAWNAHDLIEIFCRGEFQISSHYSFHVDASLLKLTHSLI